MDISFADNPAPDSEGDLALDARSDRLCALQAALQEKLTTILLKGKKKPSAGRYFFGNFPPPALRFAKTHLHALCRVRRMLLRLKVP